MDFTIANGHVLAFGHASCKGHIFILRCQVRHTCSPRAVKDFIQKATLLPCHDTGSTSVASFLEAATAPIAHGPPDSFRVSPKISRFSMIGRHYSTSWLIGSARVTGPRWLKRLVLFSIVNLLRSFSCHPFSPTMPHCSMTSISTVLWHLDRFLRSKR